MILILWFYMFLSALQISVCKIRGEKIMQFLCVFCTFSKEVDRDNN